MSRNNQQLQPIIGSVLAIKKSNVKFSICQGGVLLMDASVLRQGCTELNETNIAITN